MRLDHPIFFISFAYPILYVIVKGLSPCSLKSVFGGYFEGETPLPIPNREVKPFRADGTARVTTWESRSPPNLFIPPMGNHRGFFYSATRNSRFPEAPKTGTVRDPGNEKVRGASPIPNKPERFGRLIRHENKSPLPAPLSDGSIHHPVYPSKG